MLAFILFFRFLKQSVAATDIVKGIKAVTKGEFHVTPSLASHLLNHRNKAKELNENLPELEKLTPSEMKILKMVSDYKTSKDISEELFIHYRTVENHRTNICQKLGISGHNALLKFALQNKDSL